MNRLIFTLAFCMLLGLHSCTKDCIKSSKCSEKPITDSTCLAYWESWVYNAQTNKCEFTGYSDCAPIGFDTRAECEKCECKN